MGCFLGVTINRRKPLRIPHAHEVGSRVDPGVLSCSGIRGRSIEGRRSTPRRVNDPEKIDGI
jgi:hypothetical protein